MAQSNFQIQTEFENITQYSIKDNAILMVYSTSRSYKVSIILIGFIRLFGSDLSSLIHLSLKMSNEEFH